LPAERCGVAAPGSLGRADRGAHREVWLLRDESPAKRSSRRSGTIKLAGSNRAAQAAASNHDSSSVAAGDAGPANDADDALGVEELVTHHSSQHLADGPGFGSEPVVHGSDATK